MEKNAAEILNRYFEKIYVISLERSTDRQLAVKKKLEHLDFVFFTGTDKNDLDLDTAIKNGTYNKIKTQKLQRQRKELNTGELACALSHRHIYEKMIAENTGTVLIFEDDVIALEVTVSKLAAAIRELPENWELLYMGYMKNETVTLKSKLKQLLYHIQRFFGLLVWTQKMVANMLPRKYSNHLKTAGFHDCTHAYAITLDAAKKLVPIQTPVIYRSDDLLSHTILAGNLKAFVTEPKFFDQESSVNPGVGSEIR